MVGGGVTGSEAAWRAARLGRDVTLLTTSLDTVYALDEDPDEVEAAPGSLLAEVLRRGARSRWDAHRLAKYALEAEERLHLLQSTASALLVEDAQVTGVETWEGVPRHAGQVALCVGTFLRARLEIGAVVEQQGRLSEMAYDDLYLDLSARGFTFMERSLQSPAQAGSLPHVVRTLVLSGEEWDQETFGLARLGCLQAAGACVAVPGWPPSTGRCVADGMRLGERMAAAGS